MGDEDGDDPPDFDTMARLARDEADNLGDDTLSWSAWWTSKAAAHSRSQSQPLAQPAYNQGGGAGMQPGASTGYGYPAGAHPQAQQQQQQQQLAPPHPHYAGARGMPPPHHMQPPPTHGMQGQYHMQSSSPGMQRHSLSLLFLLET